jgi:SAM-dependent methyltransferase
MSQHGAEPESRAAFLAAHLRAVAAAPAITAEVTAGHNLAHATGWQGKLARLVRGWLPRPDMVYTRPADAAVVDRFLARATQGGTHGFVLNIGSGNKDYGPRCVNLDIFAAQHVHVQATSDAIPFPDRIFEGVMSLAVLEHVPDERAVLAECLRVLKPGGWCLHAVPFIQGFHAVPDDYRRLTRSGLRALFGKDFKEVECGILAGPASGAAWVMREFMATLTAGRSVLLYNAGMLFWGWVFWPVKFLDFFLARSPFAQQVASGVYYLGRRK